MEIAVCDKAHNAHYLASPAFFDEIVEIAKSKTMYGQYMKFHRKELYDFVMLHTAFLDDSCRFSSRLHCIFKGLTAIPKCAVCGENDVCMRDVRLYEPTPMFCSRRCQVKSEFVQGKIKTTMKHRYGVEHALQNVEIKEKANAKRIKTNIEHYGVKEVLSLDVIQRKKEQTNLERYGVKCTIQLSSVQDKAKKTCLEKYGVEYALQNKEIRQRFEDTCVLRYGDAYPIRLPEIKARLNATNREKYGVDWSCQAEVVHGKAINTCYEKYGVDYALQAPEVRERIKSTLLEKYGVEHNSQLPEAQINRRKAYKFDGRQFDSSAELCYYIWLKDNEIRFEYQPTEHFEYLYDGKRHFYCPDFKVSDMFVEIKGDHFFKPDGTMRNPYDSGQDGLYEAKHQCMLENNVKILKSAEYSVFQEYAECKFGEKFWLSLQNHT